MKFPLLIIMLLTVGAIQAQDLYTNDLNTMLYIRGTFGGNGEVQTDNSMKFGFTVNQSYVNVGGLAGFSLANPENRHHRLVDIEFSPGSGFFSRFTVGGVDALTYERVMHANGSSSNSPNGLSSDRIILGLIFGSALGYGIYWYLDDDDEDNGTRRRPPPPQPPPQTN